MSLLLPMPYYICEYTSQVMIFCTQASLYVITTTFHTVGIIHTIQKAEGNRPSSPSYWLPSGTFLSVIYKHIRIQGNCHRLPPPTGSRSAPSSLVIYKHICIQGNCHRLPPPTGSRSAPSSFVIYKHIHMYHTETTCIYTIDFYIISKYTTSSFVYTIYFIITVSELYLYLMLGNLSAPKSYIFHTCVFIFTFQLFN